MNELTIKKELNGLDDSKAKQIEAVFAPMVKMIEGFEGQYAAVMALDQSEEKSQKAKRLRLDVAKIRIQADKIRKEQKAEYLRAGNAIQGVYNILKYAVTDKEEALKEVEEHYIRLERDRVKAIQEERQSALFDCEVDGALMDLGNMTDQVWDNLLSGAKSSYDALKAAEKKAEEEAEEVKRKEREENARLKKENERLTAERDKEAKERLAIEKKAATEREIINKEKKALEDKERERKAEETKAERERLQAEIKKAEAERKKQIEAEAAPDREKLTGWGDALLGRIATLTSDAAKEATMTAAEILWSFKA